MAFNLSVTAQELNSAVTKANAAAPQSTTYTKSEVDAMVQAVTVTVDQTYDATSTNPQSGTAVAQAVSGKISATDYATQTTGGTIKAWTTTDGSDTILHLATQ